MSLSWLRVRCIGLRRCKAAKNSCAVHAASFLRAAACSTLSRPWIQHAHDQSRDSSAQTTGTQEFSARGHLNAFLGWHYKGITGYQPRAQTVFLPVYQQTDALKILVDFRAALSRRMCLMHVGSAGSGLQKKTLFLQQDAKPCS